MCLITNQQIPIIATEDIVCYKMLRISANGYYTPYRLTDVKLNDTLYPNTKHIFQRDWVNQLEGGYIHAYTAPRMSLHLYPDICFKAIIKKGSKFFISTDLDTICADSLYITDEIVDDLTITAEDTIHEIAKKSTLKEIFQEENINGHKVGIGYLYLSDKTFINPVDYNGQVIIGVVGAIGLNTATIVSLDQTRDVWLTEPRWVGCVSYEDGRCNMDKIPKTRLEDYPIFNWVLNYKTAGTNKGDWYLGAIDEIHSIFSRYAMHLNVARLLTSYPNLSLCIWSSSECDTKYAYTVTEIYKNNNPKQRVGSAYAFMEVKLNDKTVIEHES